jgi:hypothetical protein
MQSQVEKEIQDELLPGQTASDRPNLIARVFQLNLKALIVDLAKGKVFGEVSGRVYTIEFQKRGLPHAQILDILMPMWIESCQRRFRIARRIGSLLILSA